MSGIAQEKKKYQILMFQILVCPSLPRALMGGGSSIVAQWTSLREGSTPPLIDIMCIIELNHLSNLFNSCDPGVKYLKQSLLMLCINRISDLSFLYKPDEHNNTFCLG